MEAMAGAGGQRANGVIVVTVSSAPCGYPNDEIIAAMEEQGRQRSAAIIDARHQ